MIIEVSARVSGVCITIHNPLSPSSQLLSPVISMMMTHLLSVIIMVTCLRCRSPPLGHVKRSFTFEKRVKHHHHHSNECIYNWDNNDDDNDADLRSASDIMSGMRDVAPMVSRVQLTTTDH